MQSLHSRCLCLPHCRRIGARRHLETATATSAAAATAAAVAATATSALVREWLVCFFRWPLVFPSFCPVAAACCTHIFHLRFGLTISPNNFSIDFDLLLLLLLLLLPASSAGCFLLFCWPGKHSVTVTFDVHANVYSETEHIQQKKRLFVIDEP